jgi:cysteine desulfurase
VSHVIKSIKVPDTYSNGTIRISLGKNNTLQDVVEIAKALSQILGN